MLARLALRNVKRSGRDYAIYFVTVALGVAMFYAFNAIEGQAVLLDALSADSIRMLGLLNMMIGVFSGVVACVLGFLVVYANRFLIRRRRREFGTYLLLGMSAARVSRVLLYEALFVGLVSLVAGLALGIAVSQGLSFATAALMGATMTKYRFIISWEAVQLTVLCSVVLFAVSALADVLYVRRCKLASLLSAHEENEGTQVVNVFERVTGFVASVIILACAYWLFSLNGMRQADAYFWTSTALMVAGTFLFFWSASGFAVFTLTHARNLYLKGIRMFTVRQIASKVNTAFASMATVCVMLFLALTTSSVGLGLIELFVGNIEQCTRYDATLLARTSELSQDDAWASDYDLYGGDIAAYLSSRTPRWSEAVRASAQIDHWLASDTYQVLFDQVPGIERMVSSDLLETSHTMRLQLVAASQYNATCRLIGEAGVNLADDEFAVDNTLVSLDDAGAAISKNDVLLELDGVTLHGTGTMQRVPLQTSAMVSEGLVLVVPDNVVESVRGEGLPDSSYLNVMYQSDRVTGDEALANALSEALPRESAVASDETATDDCYEQRFWPVSNVYTGRAMADQAGGLRMVISFLALYIGLVMLVATAAILAIQQLSETADSLQRYRRLRDLGCEMRQILGSLRTQTVAYFCAPLLLAAAHTACAVKVVSGTLFSELGVNMLGPIGLAVGFVACVYGVYLLVTYLLSKSIVRGSVS